MGRGEPHPSEELEFATIAGQSPMRSVVQIQDIECAKTNALDDPKSDEKHPVEDLDDLTRRLTHINNLIDTSTAGIEAEHRINIKTGLLLYPKAILWSILLSLTIVMEG